MVDDALVVQIVENLSELERHNDLYFDKGKPEITDVEYDALLAETSVLVSALRSVDAENDLVFEAERIFSEVGAAPSYGKKVTHPRLMGSLKKVLNAPEILLEWAKKYRGKFVVAPKIDGLAVRLEYDGGRLVAAATRGNGVIGQDVTDNVRATKSIPNKISIKEKVTLYGEVYMRRSVFAELTESGKVKLVLPRAAASGSINQKDPKKAASRPVDFFCYSVATSICSFTSEIQMAEWVTKHLPDIEYVPLKATMLKGVKAIENIVKVWESERSGLDYDIDGLVFSVNDLVVQEEAGWTSKRPNAKMAFKFKPEQAQTKVNGIGWQVGRTGKVTPVARLDAVVVGGCTIKNATLHNLARIRELDLGIGDTVMIERSGDIIPQIVRIVKKNSGPESWSGGYINYPHECPCCGTLTREDGITVWCDNPKCDAQVEDRIMHYLRKLEVKGIGPAEVSHLRKNGMLKDVDDLYRLDLMRIAEMPGHGRRSAEKIGEAIEAKSEIPLAIFLAALGIHHFGSKAKDVVKNHRTLADVRRATAADFMTIEGIGDKIASNIEEGLTSLSDTIDRLLEHVTVVDVVDVMGSLTGKTFCLTGAMSKPRKELQKLIASAGGESKSSVGRGLDYLVQADASSTSSKAQKARKLGVSCIGEDELMGMIGE